MHTEALECTRVRIDEYECLTDAYDYSMSDTNIHVCIDRGRERNIERDRLIALYINVYIEREGERKRERKKD